MSISIITFANLGKKKNLKTADIEPVIKTFVEHQELNQVICQISKDFYFKNTQSAVPKIIRYPIRAFEKIFHTVIPRENTERLFDFFAAVKLKKTEAVLFHPSMFARTMRAAKKLGSLTIGVAASAHPLFAKELYEEELDKLNLKQEPYSEASEDKLVVNKFDYIIAMSEFVKSTYEKFGFSGEKIFVAYPDVDIKRFTAHDSENKEDKIFRIIYVAYTQPLKGFHYLLDAWESLNLENTELLIIGGISGMPEELNQRYVCRIQSDSRITWIPDTLTPEIYYREASVLVLPSLTEGLPRVTLEAMACGLPVITTENAKGIVEDGKTGFVVPIRDAFAIKEKIEYLYNHRGITRQMGIEARAAIENKKPFGEAVYEIYQEILKRENKI